MPQAECPERVDLRRLAVVGRTAGVGAFPSLPRVPAKVRSPNPQRSHALGNGNRAISSTNLHSCKPPEASWMEARVTRVARGLGKVLGVRR